MKIVCQLGKFINMKAELHELKTNDKVHVAQPWSVNVTSDFSPIIQFRFSSFYFFGAKT